MDRRGYISHYPKFWDYLNTTDELYFCSLSQSFGFFFSDARDTNSTSFQSWFGQQLPQQQYKLQILIRPHLKMKIIISLAVEEPHP